MPIVKGEKFVLSGTEVFHGRCVMKYGTASSARAKLELRVIAAERDAAVAIREAEGQRKHADQLAAARIHAEREARVAKAGKEAALRDAAYWRERAQVLEVERDQARRALAIERQYPAQAAPITPPPSPPPSAPAKTEPANDDRDQAEIRFSLLELDKT